MASDVEITIIEPPRSWVPLNLGELWRSRDLVRVLVTREVQGRYRQMAFGPLWIILTPLVNLVVFSVVFGGLARLPSDGVPYPLFAYCALLPWTFFASGLTRSTSSLAANMNVISKVYFPRLVVPISGILGALVDFTASFGILVAMAVAYGIVPSWRAVSLPLFLVLAGSAALAVALWLSALAVRYRDVGFVATYGAQALMYLSPVVYPSSMVPDRWRFWYQLNPMTIVLDGFRWALLMTRPPDLGPAVISCGLVVVALASGALYFRRTETTIVDFL